MPLSSERMTKATSLARDTDFSFSILCASMNAFKVSYRFSAFGLPSTLCIIRNLVVMQHDSMSAYLE